MPEIRWLFPTSEANTTNHIIAGSCLLSRFVHVTSEIVGEIARDSLSPVRRHLLMKILAKIRAEILLRIGNLQRRSPAGAPHLSGQLNVAKWFGL
jgi:hypothetical protein